MEPASLLGYPEQRRLSSINVTLSELSNMADDAESCCGSPTCMDSDRDHGEEASSQQARRDTSRFFHADNSTQPVTRGMQQACSGPVTNDYDGSQHAESTQHMGDDFEALDADVLFEDAAFDTYPGGVEAALADWNAAVSSKATPAAAAAAGGAEASSSSCCNYNYPRPMQQQQQQGLPGWQQLYQQRCPMQYNCCCAPLPPPAAAAKLGQFTPIGLCRQQQQQQHGLQQMGLLQQQQQQPWCLRVQLLLQQQTQQQQQQWQQVHQQDAHCPFAAFSGDVVGAVLAGHLPAPSADSNDACMGPLGHLDLPACC